MISMWAYLKLPLTSPRLIHLLRGVFYLGGPILSFHCHAIKNINASQSLQIVQFS